MAAAGFPSCYLSGPLPYVQSHITENKMSIIKYSISFLPNTEQFVMEYYLSENNASVNQLYYIILYLLYYTSLRKEGSVLFNDTLNTFYLRLYGVRHMIKDHSDSERPHELLFPISSKRSIICTIPLLNQSWSTGWNEIHIISINTLFIHTVTKWGWCM